MKKSICFFVLAILLIALIFTSVNMGSLKVSFWGLIRGLFIEYDENVAIIYDLRFPRIVIALLSGAALAVSGVLFQAVMKNPLADPGIIGISAGASFAAAVVALFFPSLFFLSPVFAFIGGIAAFLLVYILSWRSRLTPVRLILVGVAVNSVFTGLLEALNYMTGGSQSIVASIVNANISMKTWDDVSLLIWYVAFGLISAVFTTAQCNLLSLEDKTVRNLGVNVMAVRFVISLIAVLLASITTAVAGPVSFLGLIVPHIGRLLIGSDHKALVPFSILLGSFTMLLADTLGRVIAYPYEIPASIVMSVIGGPFFIFLLLRSERIHAYR